MNNESYVSVDDVKAYEKQTGDYVDSLANIAVELAWGLPLSPIPDAPARPTQDSLDKARALLTRQTFMRS